MKVCSQCNERESFDGVCLIAVTVAEITSSESNCDEPEIGEDKVEYQDVAGICAEEEGPEEERDGQDSLEIC